MPDIYRNPQYHESQEEVVMIPDIPAADEKQSDAEQQPVDEDADRITAEDEEPEAEESDMDYSEPEEENDPLCYTESDFQTAVAQARTQITAELKQQAYRDVVSSEKQRIEDILQKVDRILTEMDTEHVAFMNSYRDSLSELALAIAEKVVMHQIDADDECLKQLIMQNVNAARKEEWVSIKVSDELSGLVQSLTREMKKPEYANVTIDAGNYPKGTCMIESPNGTIDASVPEQIKNIRADFEQVK